MANKRQRKQDKGLGVGSIIALVIAGLVLIGILAGVVWYVHSGRNVMGQTAADVTIQQTTVLENVTLEGEDAAAEDDSDGAGSSEKSAKDASKNADSAGAKNTTAAAGNAAATTKASAGSASDSSVKVAYKSKATAKTLGKYYTADTDAFRKAYDGKTVTVTGTISDKSSKMLYVEFETGKKVPLRVYLSSEEQREQFNKFAKGDTITVKGTVAVLYPMNTDAGGFQEMANGLIALDSVTLVK